MTIANQQKQRLPYFEDSGQLFSKIEHEPWAVFLDSGFPNREHGRFDILASNPKLSLVTHGDVTTIDQQGDISYSDKNPFSLVQAYLENAFPPIEGLPFNGGAIGYFSYDMARRLEKLPVIAKDEENIPDMCVGIYYWVLIVDHQQQQSWLIANDLNDEEIKRLVRTFSTVTASEMASNAFKVLSNPQSNMDKDYYCKSFKRIKHYLLEGDSYQVNLAQRFSAACQGNPWFAYQRLRDINPAPFAAYLNLPGVKVLSSSPERFLKVTQREIETKPIKGTRPRNQNLHADQQLINELLNSKKDRAENVMIVDLLRNDISKNCVTGSVKVPKLFDVESFATVHHLVSTVSGTLSKGQHALDLLRNCFPGGSITGAPKIRSMEIIEELEPNRRGIYCGAIGYIGFDGNMDTNIAIRTLIHSDDTIRFWAGGGIVNDSEMEAEYQESYDKAAAMLALLEHFRADEGH